MSEGTLSGEAERLAHLLGGDSGGAAFPALAEAHRRAGDPAEAERIARAGLEQRPDALGGRVALGLALLDLERLDEARAELERVLASVPDHPLAIDGLETAEAQASRCERPWSVLTPPPDELLAEPIDEPEIDAAFEQATSEPDEMVSADGIAASAIRAADLGEPEGLDPLEGFDELETGIPVTTHTVADILESQGHDEDAESMRASIGVPPPAERERILATLDRWLENLRRDPT